jgi:hypothetical protein
MLMPTEETEESDRLLPPRRAVAGARVETQARHDDEDDIRGVRMFMLSGRRSTPRRGHDDRGDAAPRSTAAPAYVTFECERLARRLERWSSAGPTREHRLVSAERRKRGLVPERSQPYGGWARRPQPRAGIRAPRAPCEFGAADARPGTHSTLQSPRGDRLKDLAGT